MSTLLSKLTPHRRPCWTFETTPGDGNLTDSKFSGTPALKPGEPWPVCGACAHPLELFIQMNGAHLPEDFTPRWEGLLQMFFYVNYDCEGDGYLPFSNTQHVRLLALDNDLVRPTNPLTDPYPAQTILGTVNHWDYPSAHEFDDLGIVLSQAEEIDLDQTHVIGDSEDTHEEPLSSRPGDKLGGWPDWVQGVEYPECRQCQTPMRFLVQIDSEDHLPYMFGDSGCGHITQCPHHPEEVAFGWACC